MRIYSYRFIGILFVLAACFSFSFSTISRAFTCLPTCSTVDGRFLSFGGQFIDTFVFPVLTFGLGSPAGSATIEFGVFDGEGGDLWDSGTDAGPLEFTLFADPLGDTSGTFVIGTWTSDGVGGINNGMPMPDNAWFNITIDNVPEAQAESGNYLYHLVVTNVDTNTMSVNNYKFRTDGTLFIFPGDQPFGYEASARGETGDDVLTVLGIIYPNFFTPGCDPDPLCFTDPNCCNFSPYDGCFNFFFLNDQQRDFLDFWDGDLDFGPLEPAQGPPFIDTDDPNTPPGIPVFADSPNTNEQTSAGASPPDDTASPVFVRPPNIIYSLTTPQGTEYPNVNPSATNEWELFQLNTEPGCAPFICDIQVDEIPLGIWHVKVTGMDLNNLNFIRAFEKILGVDEEDNPVPPLDPDRPPVNVPTFSEWGMFAVVLFLGIIGLYHLRRKKNADASSS